VSPVELTTLGTDVQLAILDHLRLVDRLCLGLTCKRMARLVLLSSRLAPTDWTPFVDDPVCHQSSHDLLPRLMHGWMPKDRFRFCAWCCKIYTRSPEFRERRAVLPKSLVWSPRLPVPKHQWMVMSKKAKYRWMIRRWRDAQTDDGSGDACVTCGVKPNSKLWYEVVHCPACTATTLSHARPGGPRPLNYSWIEKICMETCEAVSWCADAAFEAVRGVVSGVLRFAVSQLQVAIRKGRCILP
jgi:hypothetical protein